MKRLLFIFSILLIVSCGHKTSDSSQELAIPESLENKINQTDQIAGTLQALEQPNVLDSVKSIEVFKDFAMDYSPSRKPNVGAAKLPELSDSVLSAMAIIKTSRPEEFEKYLMLIFVKLYSAHLECCHQSYEIRRQPTGRLNRGKDPLVYEFNDITKKYKDNEQIEFMPSSIGYEYVMTHRYLLDFQSIKKHVEIIERVQKNIEDGVYWKYTKE